MSLTYIATLASIISQVLALAGVTVDVESIGTTINTLVSIAGGIVALYGRFRAGGLTVIGTRLAGLICVLTVGGCALLTSTTDPTNRDQEVILAVARSTTGSGCTAIRLERPSDVARALSVIDNAVTPAIERQDVTGVMRELESLAREVAYFAPALNELTGLLRSRGIVETDAFYLTTLREAVGACRKALAPVGDPT